MGQPVRNQFNNIEFEARRSLGQAATKAQSDLNPVYQHRPTGPASTTPVASFMPVRH
jgi:hypothetical protein